MFLTADISWRIRLRSFWKTIIYYGMNFSVEYREREREREALNNFLTRFFLGTTFAKLITRHGPHNEFTSRDQKFLWHVLVLSRSFSEDKETLGHRSFLLPLKQSWGSNSTSSFTRSSFCVYTFSKCLSVSARERKQFPLFLFPDLKNFHP